jgi:hypothetical protein
MLEKLTPELDSTGSAQDILKKRSTDIYILFTAFPSIVTLLDSSEHNL